MSFKGTTWNKTVHSLNTKIANNMGGRDRTRELARTRDNWTCQICKKQWVSGQRRFDIHHIEGCGTKSLDYDSVKDLSNLITYCHKCHMNLHSVRNKMTNHTGMNKHSKHRNTYYKQRV